MNGSQFPDLRCLNEPTPPAPLSWWVRNHDLFAMALCICIAVVTAYAIGEIAEVTAFFRSFAGV